MKAVDFDYVRAASVHEACELLAAGDADRKLIAGGQTLVPLMAMRLARPAMLIDINEIAELRGIEEHADAVTIGACTRQAAALDSSIVLRRLPLLARALAHVGHTQTRNRGTVGGSIVHADPSAEIPLVAATLDARLTLASADGEEEVAAEEFFLAPMVTSIRPDQCLTRIRFPAWPGRAGCGFEEISIRAGDFAIVAAAAQVELGADGRCRRAAVGVGGAAATPLRFDTVAQALTGQVPDQARLREAAQLVRDLVEPDDDLHASAEYRRRTAAVLVERALGAAVRAAQEASA